MSRKVLSTVALIVGIATAAGALAETGLTSLPTLPTYDQGELDITQFTGTTFYKFMRGTLEAKMNGKEQSGNDDDLVTAGHGVRVTLNERNSNIHVNYFASPQSGRSYGWTVGAVGDWSDAAYLRNLWVALTGSDGKTQMSSAKMTAFYTTFIELVGACDPKTLSTSVMTDGDNMAERVANNFLAIYGAEEYRAAIPNGVHNWDDAIFDVSLLAAFHAGQVAAGKPFTLYYMGKFVSQDEVQQPGDFDEHGKPTVVGKTKAADITDYWQFTATATKKNSGINETRPDFTKLGQMITAYEKTQDKSPLVAKIEAVVKGNGLNVFEDITQYFATGKADATAASSLGADVGALMVEVHGKAGPMTEWIASQK